MIVVDVRMQRTKFVLVKILFFLLIYIIVLLGRKSLFSLLEATKFEF